MAAFHTPDWYKQLVAHSVGVVSNLQHVQASWAKDPAELTQHIVCKILGQMSAGHLKTVK